MKKPHLESTYKLFINGEWKEASDKATYKSYCPANGEVLAECAQATREDVEDAITAAWAAFETWKNVPVNERAEILNKKSPTSLTKTVNILRWWKRSTTASPSVRP